MASVSAMTADNGRFRNTGSTCNQHWLAKVDIPYIQIERNQMGSYTLIPWLQKSESKKRSHILKEKAQFYASHIFQ